MPTTSDDAATMNAQLSVLIDRAEITQLCDRYVMHLDRDRDSDSWLGSIFTEEAMVVFPSGEYNGIAEMEKFQELAHNTFARTHHLGSNYDIAVDGDQAHVRAHLMAVHVRRAEEPATHFTIGGHYEADAVRTPGGWRFSRFCFEVVWTAGEGPGGNGAGGQIGG
jgi:hypothetical protein